MVDVNRVVLDDDLDSSDDDLDGLDDVLKVKYVREGVTCLEMFSLRYRLEFIVRVVGCALNCFSAECRKS